MDMRNNTAGILAFAGATLFTLSGTYHGYSLFRNFKSIGGALPGSPKVIPLSIRNLCYCDKPKGYTCGSHHLHRYKGVSTAHYPAFIGAIRVFIAHLCYGMAQQDLP